MLGRRRAPGFSPSLFGVLLRNTTDGSPWIGYGPTYAELASGAFPNTTDGRDCVKRSVVFVPEGRPRIAQDFSPGTSLRANLSAGGTAEAL